MGASSYGSGIVTLGPAAGLVESSGPNGITIWMANFTADELEPYSS